MGSQELSNVNNLMRNTRKIKSAGFKVKQKHFNTRKATKDNTTAGSNGASSEDRVTGHGEVVEGEVIEPRSSGALPNTEEIWDAEEPRGRLGGFRQGIAAPGPKAIEAPDMPMTSGPKGAMYVAQPVHDLDNPNGGMVHQITAVPKNPNAGRQWGDGSY